MMDFLITEDTRASFGVPFEVSKENWKQKAILKDVVFAKRVETKYKLKPGIVLEKGTQPEPEQVEADSIRGVLQFHFESPDGFYTHIEEKWDCKNVQSKPEDFARNTKFLNQAILHIATGASGMNIAKELGNKAAFYSFIDGLYGEEDEATRYSHQWRYLEFVAFVMNTGSNGEPIYKNADGTYKRLQIKLTRIPTGKAVNRLQLGKGNSVEQYTDGKSTLQPLAGEHFDMVDEAAIAKPMGGMPGTPTGTPGVPPAKSDDAWPDL